MCEQIASQNMVVMIDRELYQALEALEQVAARQQAEIERLREVVRLARTVIIEIEIPFGEWSAALDGLRDAVNSLPTV